MNRTYDARDFTRTHQRLVAMRLAKQRWTSIYIWVCGSAVVSLACLAATFSVEASLCTVALGAVCFYLNLSIKPRYESKAQRKLNAEFPPTDLDS